MNRARRFAWLLLSGPWLPLAGCALPGRPAAALAAADLATAQAVAKAGGDARGAQCWGSLLPAVQALQASPAAGGPQNPALATAEIATALEVYRVAVIQAEGPCAPIVLPIVAKLGLLSTAAGVLAAAGPGIVP